MTTLHLKKSTSRSPLQLGFLLIPLALACFALSPTAQAQLSPPPDGFYPNFTTAEGQNALFSLTTGSANTAVGWFSLFSDTTGSFNTATGAGTLLFNTADAITAFGAAALLFNTTGINNTAVGAAALLSNTTGGFNTANGKFALHSNTTGSFNTANGFGALEFNTTGSGNTALGDGAGVNVFTADNVICIDAPGADVSNGCYIGRIFGATSSSGAAVVVNFEGKLGTMTSSRRFKQEIKPMDRASEMVYALEPVSFRYKKEIDPAGTCQLGLVAEDVEKVNPDLVVRDKEGKPYSVRYDQVNAMLLNEFLKEHHQVQELKSTSAKQEGTIAELKSTVAQQQKGIEALTAGLQKVSEQIQMRRPAPQVVLNNQ